MASSKYRKLTRTIYALHWHEAGAVYIGQTSSTRRRWMQHRSSGDWAALAPFTTIVLGTYPCTMLEGEEWEYAWRLCAHDAGLKVYGGSQFGAPYIVDPNRRATKERRSLRKQCKWPGKRRIVWKWLYALVALYLGWRLFL